MKNGIRTINNYSFLNEEKVMVDITKFQKGRFYLFGKYTEEWARFMGTDSCVTSDVLNITEEGEVVTKNSIYNLGSISPDYQEFLEVSNKGISFAANWEIYGERKEFGYYLRADYYSKEQKSRITARIASQEGNFLTIQRLIGKGNFAEKETVFVCWNTISPYAMSEIQTVGRVASDIEYVYFQEFNGINCRPKLEV